jgi:hypothetical protein
VYAVGLLAVTTTTRPTEPLVRALHDGLWAWGLLGIACFLILETIWWSDHGYHQMALRCAGVAIAAWGVAQIGPPMVLLAREERTQMVTLGIAGILAWMVFATVARTRHPTHGRTP